jgi:adenosylmethionine---8-amino-7-oxononanoate aminotransferase
MNKNLRKTAVKHLWHPYTDIVSFEKTDFPIVDRAEGVYLYEMDGKKLLDGISSWWCVNLGHSQPHLVKAIKEQTEKLQNSILGGMSHPTAIKLSEKIAKLAPGNLNHVYFAGDGASATEAALKISLQYWCNLGVKGRTKFICLQDGYHGDTLGAIGVGYVEKFHKNFGSVIQESYRACSPHCASCPYGKSSGTCDIECFSSMESLIREHHNEIAAVIVEPLCQGAAGIRIYPEEYLIRLRKLCNEFNLLLIVDEIAVGFARTGAMFACERAGIVPDIILIGKGLTGGYLPMSGVVVTDKIYNSFRSDADNDRTFYHGHTYCGNPICSSLALAALELYDEMNILEMIKPRIIQLKEGMNEIGKKLSSSTVLTLGMIGVIEINEADGGTEKALEIKGRARELGLFIRPLGPSVYLWPPLISTEKELGDMISILKQAVVETLRL